jgi:hypothetical protein
MLTEKGYQERMWGEFPAVREALQDKNLDEKCLGWTSVSDNMFEALPRTLKIGILARDNPDAISTAAQHIGWQAMNHDLETLAEKLKAAGAFLQDLAQEIRAFRSLE